MHVHHFNRSARKKKVFMSPGQKTGDVRTMEDMMGILDPGFEDLGVQVLDAKVAPGLMGHFGTMDNPPTDYFSMRTLERA